LQDSAGDVVHLALYGLTPDCNTTAAAQAWAVQHLAQGTRIAIAEPLLQIFEAGHRGVQVNWPTSVQIQTGSQLAGNQLAGDRREPELHAVVLTVQALMSDKQPAAAFEACLEALQSPGEPSVDFMATVLSNMAQTALNTHNAVAALQFSAAALLFRPAQAKA
jgi:hypothetical protein